ncbi:DUF6325 family protein [Leifsonia poae]|uniref:DUF6325 family protein n=1 Tax=Leifsonia poae TaxID=110933 RepID=UPI003D66A38F
MAEFQYGPVQLYLIGFDGDRPGQGVVEEIVKLVESDIVRLLDLLFVSRSVDGDVTVLEIDEIVDEYGLAELEIAELGLAGEDDVEDLSGAIEPGTSAALLVVEHIWAREFAQALFSAGGRVLQTEQIPAPIVNAVVDATSA